MTARSEAPARPPRRFPKCDASPSRVKRYEGCPRSYRHRYVDRWPDPAGPEARLGTLVHAALEGAALARVGQAEPAPAELAELLEAMGSAVPEVEEVTEEDLAAAKEMLEGLAPFDFGRYGEVLSAEGVWERRIDGVAWGGIVDLVTRRPGGEIRAVDWKTGQPVTQEEAEWDVQVGLYLVDLRQRYPDAISWSCSLVFLAAGIERTVRWTEELDRFTRARAGAAARAWQRGQDRPRIGGHCATCAYRDRCEPYRAHLAQLEVYRDPPETKDLPFPALARERLQMAETAKQAEARRKDLDRELQGRLSGAGRDKVEEGGLRVSLRSRKVTSYDVAVIPELAAERGVDPYDLVRGVCSISTTKLRKELKLGGAPAAEIAEQYAQEKETRYVEVRQLDEGAA